LNYAEALREQARRGGGSVVEEDGIVATLAAHPHPVVNNAIRMDRRIDAETCLDRIVNFYVPRGHGYTVVLRLATDDSDLGEAAAGEGLGELAVLPAMAIEAPPAEQAPPSGCRISWVSDEASLADYRSVVERAWETYEIPGEATGAAVGTQPLPPHIHAALLYAGDRPVAGALVLLSHGIAGVYWVSTLEEARGRGYAEVCTRAVTRRAFQLGARAVCLQATPMGEPVYAKIGFKTIGTYRLMAAFPDD
ncbi:MAG: GNAT family N-acetyltransferase, partial [Candidatus Dadabacteria bacterium]